MEAIKSGHTNENIYICNAKFFAWNKCCEPYALYSYACVCRYLNFDRNEKPASNIFVGDNLRVVVMCISVLISMCACVRVCDTKVRKVVIWFLFRLLDFKSGVTVSERAEQHDFTMCRHTKMFSWLPPELWSKLYLCIHIQIGLGILWCEPEPEKCIQNTAE